MQGVRQQETVDFARKHQLEGLTQPSLQAIRAGTRGFSVEKGHHFLRFQQRIDQQLLNHRIITANRYTAWFRQGLQSEQQVKAFIVQFSVFSNQFLIAQLNKMINADTVEEMRASKEILANEIGVAFRREHSPTEEGAEGSHDSGEGTVEGGVFHFRAGHFEWLLAVADRLGLEFHEIGKPVQGTEATLHFCRELIRLYGAPDYQTSQAASYAVENWAAAGFWGELIEGLKRFNERTGLALPLGFFTWHDQLEARHAGHTQEELEQLYFTTRLEEDRFIAHGNEMLDAVGIFWDGLDDQRRQLGSH